MTTLHGKESARKTKLRKNKVRWVEGQKTKGKTNARRAKRDKFRSGVRPYVTVDGRAAAAGRCERRQRGSVRVVLAIHARGG